MAATCSAFGPDGETVFEALRERIAGGRGGEEAYLGMLAALEADPEWECGRPLDGGADLRDAALAGVLAEKCPEEDGEEAGNAPARSPRLRAGLQQSVRPREAGPADARWSAEGRGRGAALRVAGAGGILRDRRLRIGDPRFALHLGHFAPALADERVDAVLGRGAYAGGGASGIGGPLSAPRAALDGLALASRLGPWRLHAAAAWNRLRPLGNMPDTLRRDAGLFAAGFSRHPASGRDGWGLKAQAMALRLEAGDRAAPWMPVAGAEAFSARDGRRWAVTGAVSYAPMRGAGAAGEAGLGRKEAVRDGSWALRIRQSTRDWANPLAARSGITRDTLEPGDGGWVASGAGEGGFSAEAAFPLAARGGWRAEARAGGEVAWAGSGDEADAGAGGVARGDGRAALAQAAGAWSWSSGAGLGWRRAGSGGTAPGGWGHSLEWKRGAWRVRARWTRMASDYAGSRPEPIGLALGREPEARGGAAWNLEWSAGDRRHPGRAQRLEGRQTWPGGKGVRVEQRLRLPWTPDGLAAGLDYQLALKAEF